VRRSWRCGSVAPTGVEPSCALAGRCGGCDWLHVAHAAQVGLKRDVVREALLRTGRIARDAPPLEPGPALATATGCSSTATLGRPRLPGNGRPRVVAAASCPVAVAPVNALLADPPTADSIALDRFTAFGDASWVACEGRDDGRELAVTVSGRTIRFSVGCFFQSNLAAIPVGTSAETGPTPRAYVGELRRRRPCSPATSATRDSEVRLEEAADREADGPSETVTASSRPSSRPSQATHEASPKAVNRSRAIESAVGDRRAAR